MIHACSLLLLHFAVMPHDGFSVHNGCFHCSNLEVLDYCLQSFASYFFVVSMCYIGDQSRTVTVTIAGIQVVMEAVILNTRDA